jgi:hypothetical protein
MGATLINRPDSSCFKVLSLNQCVRAYQVDIEMGITRPPLKIENPTKNLKNKKCQI